MNGQFKNNMLAMGCIAVLNKFSVQKSCMLNIGLLGIAIGLMATFFPVTVSAQKAFEVMRVSDGVMTGSFTSKGRTIYFESKRGDANPGNDPDAPPYAMDIRIMDSNRVPFIIQSGGSSPALNPWGEDESNQDGFDLDLAERLRAFRMLPAAASTLTAYLEQNSDTISYLDETDLRQIIDLMASDRSKQLQNLESADDARNFLEAPSATFTHKAFVMRKQAFFNGFPGEHSALLLRIYSGTRIVRELVTCNHGTCATQSSMYSKCLGSFQKSNSNIYTRDQACDQFSSPYITQGWPYVYGHVCNNDTRQQYLSVKGSSNMNWGICYFSGTSILAYYRYAPSCD